MDASSPPRRKVSKLNKITCLGAVYMYIYLLFSHAHTCTLHVIQLISPTGVSSSRPVSGAIKATPVVQSEQQEPNTTGEVHVVIHLHTYTVGTKHMHTYTPFATVILLIVS